MAVFSAAELGSLFDRPSAVGKRSSIMRTGVPMPQVATAINAPSAAQLRRASRLSSGNKALTTVVNADQTKRLRTATLVGSSADALGIASGAYLRRQVAAPVKAGFGGAFRVGQARQVLREATRSQKMAAMGPAAIANAGIVPGQARQALTQSGLEAQRHLEAAAAAAAKGDGAGVGRNLKAAGQTAMGVIKTALSIRQMRGKGAAPGVMRTDMESMARVNVPGASPETAEFFSSGAWLLDEGSMNGMNFGVISVP